MKTEQGICTTTSIGFGQRQIDGVISCEKKMPDLGKKKDQYLLCLWVCVEGNSSSSFSVSCLRVEFKLNPHQNVKE